VIEVSGGWIRAAKWSKLGLGGVDLICNFGGGGDADKKANNAG